jgi:hypothetical protein
MVYRVRVSMAMQVSLSRQSQQREKKRISTWTVLRPFKGEQRHDPHRQSKRL